MSELDEQLNELRRDLEARADELGPAKYEMYREGIHTGHLNALHQISPHCAKGIEEARYWHREGVRYIELWKERLAATVAEKQE